MHLIRLVNRGPARVATVVLLVAVLLSTVVGAAASVFLRPVPDALPDVTPLACPGGPVNVGTVDHLDDERGEPDLRAPALRWAEQQPVGSAVWGVGLRVREERGLDAARVSWLDDAGRVQARLTFVPASGGGWLLARVESC